MMTFSVNAREIRQLSALLDGNKKKVRQQAAIAVNATSRKAISMMAKEVGKELAVPQKIIKTTVKTVKRARAKETPISAVVRQSHAKRLSLRHFKPKQNKQGVTYRISKTEGRRIRKGAFQGPRPGVMKVSWRGNAFRREGKARNPIVKMMGASPWAVFVKKGIRKLVVTVCSAELNKQLRRRVRFLALKRTGAI